ncbi:hypothetical protein AMC87_PD00123 (plasmid) [Rhizobium phaseoli]|nr:hypothetical protein AMC87_PD00123 [Rhizobium phaseoli]
MERIFEKVCIEIPLFAFSKRDRQRPSRRQSLGLRGLPGFCPAVHPVGFLAQPVVALGPARSQRERRNPSHQLAGIKASDVPDRNLLILHEAVIAICFRNRRQMHLRENCAALDKWIV